MKNILIVLAIAITIGGAIYVVSSEQNLFTTVETVSTQGDTESNVSTNTNNKGSGEPLRSQGFNYDQFLKLVGSLNKEQRDAVLADKELVNKVISQESLRLSFIDAAKASQFARDENTRYLLERQTDDFLVTNYINHRLKVAGVPEGFPDEDQVQQFYEKNKQSFSIGERMPVWQVFWSIPKDMDKAEIARLLKLASSVSGQLRNNKLTFAQAATKYSQHAASSIQGGFMGVLKTAELRPKIKEALINLKQNSISKPVRSDSGLHIMRRGAALPAEVMSLDRVRPQVVEALIKALRVQQRAQLNKLVQEQYPVNIDAEQSAEWASKAASFYN
jgi:parvulin-like peptidyl-prolyl isomerase